MNPAAALAVSCPNTIMGAALAGITCDFDSGSSVTVANGGSVEGINMNAYSPASPSFILNNDTIGDASVNNGLLINSSSLSNGINNTGNITTPNGTGIQIGNASAISGGITNSGTIASGNESLFIDSSTITGGINNTQTGHITSTGGDVLVVTNSSTISGGITNNGTISSSGVFAAVVLDNHSTVTNGLLNTGTIEATGNAAGVLIRSNSSVSGGITNSGTISSAGNIGLVLLDNALVNGNVTNETHGTISGSTAGVSVHNATTINGNLINQAGATISSGDTGIQVFSDTTINGAIQNYGTISGTNTGIAILTSATMTGAIQNHGTIQGDTFAIHIDPSSTAGNIDLFGGSRVIGAIEALNTNINIVGDFTTEGTMDVHTLNISSDAVFTMANTITVGTAVNNAGTLAVGTTLQTIAGNYTQSTGGILKIGVQNTTTYGQLAVTGTADLSQSGAINVNVVNGAHIAVGNVFTNVISGNTLTGPGGGFDITDNSRFLNFTAAPNGSNTGVNLTAVYDESNSVSHSNAAMGNRGGVGAAGKLDDMIALSPVGDWQNVIGALNTLNTDQQITNAVNQTVPVLTGATNTAIIETMSTASQIVQARQEVNSGLSAGEDFQTNRNFWLKTFGSWGNQGNDNGVVGYDSKTYGIIGGVDKVITDKARLGVGISYFNSELGSNDGDNRVNVDSYLGMVYGSYSLDDRTDVNAQVEAGYNSSDSTRDINFGGLNRIAQGSYGGWDFHAGTGVGRIMNLGSDTTITPQARLDYFAVGNESYNESGAGVLNLHVDSQTQDQLMPALQAKVNHNFTPELSLALNAGLGYDLLNNHNTVSASFAGGGGIFTTRGLESSPWAIRSGAGLTWKQSDALDLTARYDREDRGSNYDNQTASLKLRMPF